ncbi:GNAT family N-acetyltransferase [Breznakiella homolactica]|uniref:GNAT family N-acetyltransferase n=1 Tax=Breznakiella homolactica TaxID=2798577 RepID=A0A7T8B8Q7_9SPIR|nr:GNAT family N-acetyltransferase [Breznakiella homolactica]QQO07637.1 GNAT family N-acetyltransferase [Breznakiella homolactica]
MNDTAITIRYADTGDYTWLSEHDGYITGEVLKSKIENKEVYIVEKDNTIIGWLRYNLFWDMVPFMNMLNLLDGFKGKGAGTRLVRHWEEEMKRKGYTNVLTSTQSDEEAQHFYRKLGYTEIGGFKYFKDPYEIIFQKIF